MKRIIGLSVILLWASFGSAFAQQQGGAEQELAGLKKRVAELEAQLLNMQVIIGSLESLVKKQRSPSVGQFSTQSSTDTDTSGGSNGSEGGSERISILETKVQALTGQIEQLTLQLQRGSSQGQTNSNNTNTNNNGNTRIASVNPNQGSDGNPGAMYDQAYSYLLARNYPAAQRAFSKFLRTHKNNSLAGNAQYWLGEAYFQQGSFKKAADSFLKGYTGYRKSPKAPDSLLKLAMSLDKLGKKNAACTSLSELKNKYPEAPGHIMKRANSEISRLGC